MVVVVVMMECMRMERAEGEEWIPILLECSRCDGEER